MALCNSRITQAKALADAQALPFRHTHFIQTAMSLEFATRLNNVETSAIRELFKLLGKPGIISFAGGFPDPAMFDVKGIREAVNAALTEEAGATLQYGATEGHNPLREQLATFMASKGCNDVAPDQLIVTTGSQQALDLLG
jgi:2-aminoadipate transaminase